MFCLSAFQMLKYVESSQLTRLAGDSNYIMTRIVVAETDVHHSGTYSCEPGEAPRASVNVHVLDGEKTRVYVLILLLESVIDCPKGPVYELLSLWALQ